MRSPVRATLAAFVAAAVPLTLVSLDPAAQAGTLDTGGAVATSVNVGADTYASSAHPSTNYGTATTLYVDGSPSVMASYLKFDLSGYAGKTLTSAQLSVRTTTSSAAGSPNTQTIRTVANDSWSETGLTYNNRPAAGSAIGTISHTSPNTSYSVPLDTAAVQAEVGHSMSIAIDQPTSATDGLDLVSAQGTAGYRPTLILQFASTSTTDTGSTGTTDTGSTSGTGTTGTTGSTGSTGSTGTTGTTTGSTGTTTGSTGEAATAFNWGAPIGGDEFNYTGAPNSTLWSVWNSAGHAGNGLRSPSQVTVNGSALQITGLSNGTTGGMSYRERGRTYGRWETRMRVNARDPEYHPVLILWPDQGRVSANNCAEMDYSESTSDTTKVKFFLHYSCSGAQATTSQSIDMTQWHNYAIEWTPAHVIGYVDGKEWFRDENTSQVPDDPAHQTIQLDWFPDGTTTTQSWMQVDWMRTYKAP